MFAACASSSIIDSDAQHAWMHVGARSGQSLNMLCGVLPVMRRFVIAVYWSPALNDSILAPLAGALLEVIPRMSGAPRVEVKLAESTGVARPSCSDAGVGLFENTIMYEVTSYATILPLASSPARRSATLDCAIGE